MPPTGFSWIECLASEWHLVRAMDRPAAGVLLVRDSEPVAPANRPVPPVTVSVPLTLTTRFASGGVPAPLKATKSWSPSAAV